MKGRPHLIPALVVAVMLLIATMPLAYEYYLLLRWATCGVSIFIAIKAYNWGRTWATWLFGIVAVLFNPLIPIHLTKEIWQPIDLICALLFGLSMLLLKEPTEKV